MTISDAMPIQFWPASQETFNEKEICGVMPDCFCQPWNCDDEIHVQFQDTTGQNLELNIYDNNGVLLHAIAITEIDTGVYYFSFIPSELSPEVCNKQVSFSISGASVGVLDDQSGDVSGWSNIDDTGDRPWIVSPYLIKSTNFIGQIGKDFPLTIPSLWTDINAWDTKTSTYFETSNVDVETFSSHTDLSINDGQIINIAFTVFVTGTLNSVSIDLILTDNTGTQQGTLISNPVVVVTTDAILNFVARFQANANVDWIYLQATGSNGNNCTIKISINDIYTIENKVIIESGSEVDIDINISSGNTNKHLYAIVSQSFGITTQTVDFGSSLSTGINTQTTTLLDDFDQIELYAESTTGEQLQITSVSISKVTGPGTIVISNKTFTTSLSPWTNEEGFDTPIGPEWSYNTTGPDDGFAELTLPGSNVLSDFLTQILPSTIPSGTTVSIDVTVGGTDGGGRALSVAFYDGSNLIDRTEVEINNVSNGVHNFTMELIDDCTHIIIYARSISATTLTILEVSDVDAGSEDLYNINNGSFSTGSFWTNSGSGYIWSISGGVALFGPNNADALKVFFSGNTTSNIIRKTISLTNRNRLDYDIILTSTVSPNVLGMEVTAIVELRNNGLVIESFEFLMSGAGTSISDQKIGSLTLTSDIDEIYIYGENVGIEQSVVLTITDIFLATSETLVKSDCHYIKTSHDCTELIEYSNPEDFDDIVYDISPAPSFFIRVPAQFWKEDNPQEQEDIELSNGEIVTLRQSIQEKRLLEIGYCPNYFHKKIQKILMHDTITIDGDNWKRRDEYETENIKKYPKKTAQCWLTLYNSIERNTL